MSGRVIILNGGSSSGKTTLGRRLQGILPGSWLLVGIDHLLWTLPPRLYGDPDGITFTNGEVSVGSTFRSLSEGYRRAVATLAAETADLVVDEVFVRGGDEQEEWRSVLGSAATLWVGVRCSPEEAERRNVARGDRMHGLALAQALSVHAGVTYDVEVDTEVLTTAQAATVVARLASERFGFVPLEADDDALVVWRSAWPRGDGSAPSGPWES